jgi:hypothetical protein
VRIPFVTGQPSTARGLVVTCVVATLALCACATADDAATSGPASSETGSATPTPDATVPTPMPDAGSASDAAPTPEDATLDAVVDRAIDDLTQRLGEGEEFGVVVARHETFPDGSLGCPQEGELYTQALVEGYRVVLGRDERVWLYTAGEDGMPALCPSDEKDGGREFVPPPGYDE